MAKQWFQISYQSWYCEQRCMKGKTQMQFSISYIVEIPNPRKKEETNMRGQPVPSYSQTKLGCKGSLWANNISSYQVLQKTSQHEGNTLTRNQRSVAIITNRILWSSCHSVYLSAQESILLLCCNRVIHSTSFPKSKCSCCTDCLSVSPWMEGWLRCSHIIYPTNTNA